MTISVQEYFTKKTPVRKKEPQYVAFINKNSCTSCNSCASMCPVDCIYEVPGFPSESYHQIDTARCIGCQMCYRVPSESTGPWTMEICPWNAIDLIYNPNFKSDRESLLAPYYVGESKGEGEELDLHKLEELGYQLYLNRRVHIRPESVLEENYAPFLKPTWSLREEDEPFAILVKSETDDFQEIYETTAEGSEFVDFLYHDYEHMFLD
ncbi:NADH dehydrogenase subunit I [Planctomycetes bacterium Pan216]|uniref:NADH dehydrogenase subunit I n=1 Tax=Kolteria novifilia TaxID=2527975 RepID=A0A518B9M9_9BACT|nr:NADH dehydrogenase subunit I [Planctomycetes bacterium Pan216]